jgi:hypothetical protein
MFFFQYLFYNQYAEISRRGGNSRQAQFNTIILSTALITMLIIVCFIVYGKFYPGFREKNLSMGGIGGKAVGRLMAAVIGVIMFFILKFFIGSKEWYNRMVDQFEMLGREEQDCVSKKGLRYFFIAALPVIGFIIWALVF